MSITRINQFTAKPGAEQDLYAFLAGVIATIRACPGCLSCTLLRGAEDPGELAIIETWSDIAAHQAAAQAIPPQQLAQAMALLAKPPVGRYYRE